MRCALLCSSITDATCPPEHRGKYAAFTQSDSAGCRHLQDLQRAGLTHIHLLPTYDIGSVPERAADQQTVKVQPQTGGPPSPNTSMPYTEMDQGICLNAILLDDISWSCCPMLHNP